jgi:hypothetical protein
MRSELKALGSHRRYTFVATFERYGSRENHFSAYPEITMLFLNVMERCSGKKVTDHIWLKCGKRMETLGELKKGDMIQFDARVDQYVKGYQGRKAEEMGEDWSELDWRLSFPTNVKRIEKQTVIMEAA